MQLKDNPVGHRRRGFRAYLAGMLITSLALTGVATSLAARELGNRNSTDEGLRPADVVYLHADGSAEWKGATYSVPDLDLALSGNSVRAEAQRLFADHRAPAALLIHLMTLLSPGKGQTVALSVF
jgi:hypothetical protein